MPRRRKPRTRVQKYVRRGRTARRATMARRRRGGYRLSRRLPALTGFPNKKLVRLRYTDNISLDPAAGGVASHYFTANGMYDPDISGIGHQPLGFDQWCTIFDHFTVIGSKISMTCLNQADTAGGAGHFGVILDDNTTFTYTTGPQILEGKQGKGAVLLTGAHQRTRATARRGFSTKKFFSTSSIIGQDGYKGSASANPTEQAYFGCWMSSISTGDPGGVNFLVSIEYLALFTEPKFLAQS